MLTVGRLYRVRYDHPYHAGKVGKFLFFGGPQQDVGVFVNPETEVDEPGYQREELFATSLNDVSEVGKLTQDKETMKKIEKGDRVSWFSNPSLKGTVKEIYLTANPFYVVWDKGTDDWYKGEDLRKVEE